MKQQELKLNGDNKILSSIKIEIKSIKKNKGIIAKFILAAAFGSTALMGGIISTEKHDFDNAKDITFKVDNIKAIKSKISYNGVVSAVSVTTKAGVKDTFYAGTTGRYRSNSISITKDLDSKISAMPSASYVFNNVKAGDTCKAKVTNGTLFFPKRIMSINCN